MTEERLNELRQTDANLRDALKVDVAERPQMPADLNERLMQRVAMEKKKPRRIIWPWIAAACVAGVLMIWLTPPKDTTSPLTPLQEARGNSEAGNEVEAPVIINSKVEEFVVAKVDIEEPSQRTPRAKKVRNAQKALAPQTTEACNDLATVQENEVSTPLPSGEGQGGGSVVTLSEHDIPITRPENLKYTPEEMALMKKQANEAYLKWVELELEIAKYHLEQTAQNN